MRATVDFSAHMNGVDYSLKKGEEFKGAANAAKQLQEIGLLEEGAKKGKVTENER